MKTLTAGGVEIPVLGFGTWMITGPPCAAMVEHALKLGYRHVDTAAAYENEREVGQGLKASGVARDEVLLRRILQQDAVAIPKTADPTRAKENLEVFDFELDASEMTQICALARPDGRVLNPSFAPEWD